ncbi:MAG: hypothetical protein KJN99_10775, partial [Marinicaulis sp.]|nr:hypothetical protein [Marinicaulis sp.]
FAPRNGDLIRVAPGGPELIDEVPAGRLFLDGDILVADGAAPIRERRKLAEAGFMAISLVLNNKNELVDDVLIDFMGVVVDEDAEGVADAIEDAFDELPTKKRNDDEAVELCVKRAVRVFFDREWGKRPLIHTLIHRIRK